MAKGSYNSVGAGDYPVLNKSDFMFGEAHDGGNQTFHAVTVATDIPKVAPRSGYGKDMGSVPGEPTRAARPGGSQEITSPTADGQSGVEKI